MHKFQESLKTDTGDQKSRVSGPVLVQSSGDFDLNPEIKVILKINTSSGRWEISSRCSILFSVKRTSAACVSILLRHWVYVKSWSPEGTKAAVTSDLPADLHSNVVQK